MTNGSFILHISMHCMRKQILNLNIKTAKVTTNKNLPLPKGYEAKLQQLLTGQRVGLGLGALANQIPE